MSMRLASLFLAVAAGLAVPAYAQFAITVQQNGQGFNVANASSITLNAAAPNQSATASVTLTYLGANSVVFNSAARITGSSSFSGGTGAVTLSAAQSTTFNLNYSPNDAAQATASFFWPYSETDAKGNLVASGAINLNLIGTEPNVTLGQITSSGSFIPIASGGSLSFPDTLVNAASKITFAISNPGSGPATINSLSVTGEGYELQGFPLLPVTLNAGSQISLALQFLPLSPGVKTGSIQVALPSRTLTVALSGRGVSSFLSYQEIQNNTTVPVNPNQVVNLGNANVGGSASAVIQFQNTGTAPAPLSTLGLTGAGFTIIDGPFLPLTLQPQQTNSITIKFTPTQPGLFTGRLVIGTDVFTVSGRGLGPLLQYSYAAGGATLSVNPSEVISFPPIPAGQSETLDFTITNAGTTAASLLSIGLLDTKGTFQLTRISPLPLQLEPGASTIFTIGFSPQTAGLANTTLLVNNQPFGLSGFGSLPLQYSYKSGASTVVANPGDTVFFQPLSVGQTGSIQFSIGNRSAAATTVSNISVTDTKGLFQLSGLPRLPLQLAPNATATFTVTLAPQSAGQTTTTLIVNDQPFALSGFASAPGTLPSYHFTGASGTQQPFQQPLIGLSLDATYATLITGVLTLTSASTNFGTDPAVQFSSGGRQVSFTIPAGSLDAIFPSGSTQIRLQSGTAAGTITITPAFSAGPNGSTDITPQNPKALQLAIAPLAPVLLSASLGTRTLTSFSILVSGFSTTRFLDHLTVKFTPASGVSIGSSSATIDISAAARIWFQSAASQSLGGQFSIEIPFTLGNGSTGTDLTKSLSGVSITATNETGTSNAVTVSIP